MLSDQRRLAIHHAGHAVVQTLVSRGRYLVSRVSLDGPHDSLWHGRPTHGEAMLDREVFLGLYEFGLVTLAGIAAENRYMSGQPPEAEPLVALNDLAAWQEQAVEVLENDAQIRLVSINVLRKLQEWMADDGVWAVVINLAEELLASESVQGPQLQRILAPLSGRGAK